VFDFSLDTPPAPDLRRFQNFHRIKRDTRKSIEPAAAPTITPMIRPRELAIDPPWAGSGVEVFTAVLEDDEVASGDGDEVDDTDVDIDEDEDAEGFGCRCSWRCSRCIGSREDGTLSLGVGISGSQLFGAAAEDVVVVPVCLNTEGKAGLRAWYDGLVF
jgi:hypothetical protein